LTPTGVFNQSHFPLATSSGGETPKPLDPRAIARGPTGAIWLIESGVKRVIGVGLLHQPCRTAHPTPTLSPTPIPKPET
jgi:hypothetical protein